MASPSIIHTPMDTAVRAKTEPSESADEKEDWRTLRGIPCITGGITALVASFGGTLRGHTRDQFPWKALPKELARLGFVLVDYPVDTLMPGETRVDLARTKGIRDLTAIHRLNLIRALKHGTLTIRAVTGGAARACLTSLKDPVIIEQAPLAHSTHSHGRRMFADGSIDQQGLPRLTCDLHLHPSRMGRMHRRGKLTPRIGHGSRPAEARVQSSPYQSRNVDVHNNAAGNRSGALDDSEDDSDLDGLDSYNDEDGDENGPNDDENEGETGNKGVEGNDEKDEDNYEANSSVHAAPAELPANRGNSTTLSSPLGSPSEPDLSSASEMLAKTCPPASQPSNSTILKGRAQGSGARSQGDISFNLSNSPTITHGLSSSPSLPMPQPKRSHPVSRKPCALIESSSSSTPLHLATPDDEDGERNESNGKRKRKVSIESVGSCKENTSAENLRPTKHQRLIGAAPVVHRHEQFWIPDGNTVLEVGGVLFKLHHSRLVDQSTFFACLLDEHNVHMDDSVVVENDGNGTVYHLSNITSKDFEALLQLDRNQMAYYFTPPPFPVLAAIIRAATALGFNTHRAFATRLLENAWSPSLADLSIDKKPNAVEVVVLARSCGIKGVLKRAFYEMVRVVGCSLGDSELDGGNGEGSQEISRADERRLGRMREHLTLTWSQIAAQVDSSFICPNQPNETSGSVLGSPASTEPSSSTSVHSSKCPSLSSKQMAWVRRVHDSGLYKEYLFDPLCGLQALIDIKWDEDEGWCLDCVRVRRDAWTRMHQRTWEHVGVWMGLEA